MYWLKLFALKALAAFPALKPTEGTKTAQPLIDSKGDSPLLSSAGEAVFNILTLFAGIIAVIFLIYYGIQYITSGGSPDKAKVARQGIINAVIGIVLVVAAYAIIRFAISIGGGLSNIT